VDERGRRAGRPTTVRPSGARLAVVAAALVCGLASGSATGAAAPPAPPAPAPPAPAPPAPGASSPAQVRPPASELPPGEVPAPPSGAGVAAPGAGYAWPLLPAPAVRTPFRAPEHVYGPGHRGVDLAGTAGQPVLAARAGAVVFAGPVAGRGVVSVQHDDGLRTTYEPVRPLVAAGAVVRAGDVVGLLDDGHPGCPSSACLHWGVRRERTEYLDPLVLLRPPRLRLLPVPVPWPVDPP
jgi:murein DD-endopeptidase MepM/ murein hydrolase activator NlpD